MNTNIFLQKASNVFAENRLLKFSVGIMAAAVIVNSFMVYRAVKYQRTILIPPAMTGTVEFVQGKPTEGYIKDMARRIGSLATTYSPPTARGQFEELLTHFAPEAYPEASKSWYSLASRVEESQVSSTFYLEKIFQKENSIELFGKLVQFAGDTPVATSATTFVIDYRIRDGRFEVLSFKEKNLTPEKPEK